MLENIIFLYFVVFLSMYFDVLFVDSLYLFSIFISYICSLISRDRLIILPLKRKYARTMFNQNPAVAVVIILWQASMLLQVERSVIILQQAGINWWKALISSTGITTTIMRWTFLWLHFFRLHFFRLHYFRLHYFRLHYFI